MDFKIGIYKDIKYEEYASIPAFRSHDLTSAIKCAYTWKNQGPMKESPALIEGRVQHTVFLEFDKFDDEFVIEPNVDRRTKAGKAEFEDFKASIGDRSSVKRDMYDVCMDRREVVKDYIPSKTDNVELSLCFEWCGHPFKARLDCTTALASGILKQLVTPLPEALGEQSIISTITCKRLYTWMLVQRQV